MQASDNVPVFADEVRLPIQCVPLENLQPSAAHEARLPGAHQQRPSLLQRRMGSCAQRRIAERVSSRDVARSLAARRFGPRVLRTAGHGRGVVDAQSCAERVPSRVRRASGSAAGWIAGALGSLNACRGGTVSRVERSSQHTSADLLRLSATRSRSAIRMALESARTRARGLHRSRAAPALRATGW
jgi:hypothetical protein